MRRATLRQMQVFDAVARHLSFSRAAQELHLTQPAVSLQIKQLEGLTRLALFEQIGRKIFLTAAGETLLGHVRAILKAIEDAEDAMASLRGESSGHLRIAVVSTAKYFAPDLLSAFTQGYPGIDLSLTVANRAQIIGQLADNEMDLAIMGYPPDSLNVAAEAFAPHPSVFIGPPSHKLASKSGPLSALEGETFIVREEGSGTRGLMEKLLKEQNVKPGRVIEMASNETIKQAVMAGMGVSFLSRHTVGLEVSVGKIGILAVAGTPIVREWYIVHREGKRLLPVAQAFVQFVKEQGRARIEAVTRAEPPRRSRNIK